jgi:DNA-directed RNA polymerase specialized sigma24 family protein
MAADLGPTEGVDKAFVTAFLLSGNAKRAESAVSQSIERMAIEGSYGEELLQGAVRAAVRPQEAPWGLPQEWEAASSKLPLELQRVLCLTPYLRQCFVLRVLLGLSSIACAVLLDSDADQVDRAARAAVLQLPANRAARFATYSGCKN